MRCEAAVDDDWTWGARPGSGSAPTTSRSAGSRPRISRPAPHTFIATADDGVRVYLDGTLVIDQWKDQSATTYIASRTVTAGNHEVKVEYSENGGDAVAKVTIAP